MTDFLLELRSEEIPARMQDKARDDLARLFAAELDKAGLKADAITTYATPRRLALIATGLPLETQAVSEETKGPKTSAAPQALEGFLRKTGLTQDQLVDRDGVYFAVVEKPGRKTSDVLAEAIPAIIRAFPWPKSQRWGAASISTESLRWVRPLQGIVALLGDDVVPCAIDGITSGSATLGHRFHHPGAITIGNAGDYAAKLRACHVIVDQEERRAIIREGAEKVAADAGLVLVPDEGLVNENSGLTEWPVPMLGRFDPAFLAVPEEVIQLTARVNQKYFVCKAPAVSADTGTVSPPLLATTPQVPKTVPVSAETASLANAFVCTANIVASDGGAVIVAGNEKVLAARLSDAKFFWEQDLKVPLDDQAKKLSSIVFHEKLGTVADKVERVAKLARWLVESGVVGTPPRSRGGGGAADGGGAGTDASAESSDATDAPLHRFAVPLPVNGEDLATQAERAARLCKADLVTGMVGEFPELQGLMGGYYARAQGEDDAVADAVRDHYKPVGQGDDVPTAPVTVAVSLADKLDTLAGFFAIREIPTGSKDPFALRRAAIGILRIIETNQISMPVAQTVIEALSQHRLGVQPLHDLSEEDQEFVRAFGPVAGDERAIFGLLVSRHISQFLAGRLQAQLLAEGKRQDFVTAVFYTGTNNFLSLLRRAEALQAFVGTADGVNLLAGYKRAANILKSSPSLLGEGDRPQGGGGENAPPSVASQLPPPRDKLGEDLSGAETALLNALNTAEPLAAAAIEAEDFEAAMSALASLRAPIDAFFEGVMVNDPDPQKRAFRLGLLARFRDAVHRVADFSKIEG